MPPLSRMSAYKRFIFPNIPVMLINLAGHNRPMVEGSCRRLTQHNFFLLDPLMEPRKNDERYVRQEVGICNQFLSFWRIVEQERESQVAAVLCWLPGFTASTLSWSDKPALASISSTWTTSLAALEGCSKVGLLFVEVPVSFCSRPLLLVPPPQTMGERITGALVAVGGLPLVELVAAALEPPRVTARPA